jgi:hypothetical protein
VVIMRRTSFFGALFAMAVGAVLAFAIHGSPGWLNLQTAGLIVLIGAAADLLIRSLVADSPLLSRRTADIAAVVEPLGEPVLDAEGNPIMVPGGPQETRPPLVAPLPGTMPDPASAQTILVSDELGTQVFEPGQPMGPAQPTYERALYEAAAGPVQGGGPDTPQSPMTVTTITGRPVRPRGRGGRSRRAPRDDT